MLELTRHLHTSRTTCNDLQKKFEADIQEIKRELDQAVAAKREKTKATETELL